MALKRAAAMAFASAALFVAPAASADDQVINVEDHEGNDAWLRFITRKHLIAMIEAGIIVLPNAPVSQSTYGGSVPFTQVGSGDATIQLGIHIIYRPFRDWSFGANFLFDPSPTSSALESPSDPTLSREHTRAYFFAGGEGRFIPLHWRSIEGFIGAQTGVVIVADRFTTNAGIPKPSIFGEREVSLSSEGFYIGAQLGLDWYISDKVVAGLVSRYNHWLLPEQPKCSPIGDCTSLQGNVDSIDFGFTLGYRINL